MCRVFKLQFNSPGLQTLLKHKSEACLREELMMTRCQFTAGDDTLPLRSGGLTAI
jgi:hypothetical protein